MKEVSEFLEAADAGRRLGMTSAGVVLHARTGRLRVAAVTPRGTRLFDPRDVERFRRQRDAQRRKGARS